MTNSLFHFKYIEYMRIVKKYINEKFTLDSDPIRDMGIGTFGGAKVGDFIKSKKPYTLSGDIFINPEPGRPIIKTTIALIIDVNREGNKLTLRIIPFIELENKRMREMSSDPEKTRREGYCDVVHTMTYEKWIEFFDLIHKEDILKRSVNEKFVQDSDPIQDLDIGIRHKIKEWLTRYEIKNYRINKDMTISVIGNVSLRNKKIEKLPDYIQFKSINGTFDISDNKITTLKGCPKMVSIYFFCCNHNLDSLNYAPKKTLSFVCWTNYNVSNKIVKFTYEDVLKVCEVTHDICDDVGRYLISKKMYKEFWSDYK
jgi:hypothetical protein